MSLDVGALTGPAALPLPGTRRERTRQRRRLADQDRRSATAAELRHLRHLLAEARELVEHGWLQHRWSLLGPAPEPPADAVDGTRARPVVAACLVGAVASAGGWSTGAPSQAVHRTLELVWHALHGRGGPVRWCPAPAVRAVHHRDLTTWNDHPSRTRGQVVALLGAADRLALQELGRLDPG